VSPDLPEVALSQGFRRYIRSLRETWPSFEQTLASGGDELPYEHTA